MTMRASTDVGGTFTDYVLLQDGKLKAFKTLTTPEPSTGILRELEGLELEAFSHGTTVAVNAIIQRKGVETVLFTTKGFRDVVHVGRQSRTELYSFLSPKPQLPLTRIEEVEERTLADGSVEGEPDTEKLLELARPHAQDCEAAVVCFLNSYVNPHNELKAARALEGLFPTVVASHQVRREIREYERFSTAVMEGYTAPLVHDYIEKLKLLSTDFSVMQSNGGKVWPEYMKVVNMVMSGPAGGVAATEALCRRLGIENAIAYDMGGTSADISALVDGRPLYTDTVEVTGIPLKTLAIDIESIGAGGGSIAWLDDGGSLKVGPGSAGSVPGPACYGQGGKDFTVSDANLLAGVLGERVSTVALSSALAEKAARPLCAKLGMTPVQLAEGVIRVVDSNMTAATRKVSVGRGYDPRNFALVSFGGAGPMHSCAIASALGMKQIVIPPMAGAFSALGIMFAPVRFDYLRTLLKPLDAALELIPGVVEEFYNDLRGKLGDKHTRAQGLVSLDMRYQGQGHQLEIPLTGEPSAAFHKRHGELFGFTLEDSGMEVVNVKMVAELPGQELPLASFPHRQAQTTGSRTLQPYGKVPVYLRNFHGSEVSGPCIIQDETTTVRVDEGWQARLDNNDVLFLEVV